MEGASGEVCTSGSMSTVSKEDNLVLSTEVSSYPDEAGLELGLGLSLGGGGVKPQEHGWGQYGRILTAKDFPSTVSSSSSSSSSLSRANRTTAGTKRRADSVAASNSGRYHAFPLLVLRNIYFHPPEKPKIYSLILVISSNYLVEHVFCNIFSWMFFN